MLPSPSKSRANRDQDFDQTAEMSVNDFDDEHTLEEEEALESAESLTNEIDDILREAEMPVNEVLAMYGCESGVEYDDTIQEVLEHESESSIDSSQEIRKNSGSPHVINNTLMQSQSDSSPTDEPTKVEVMDLDDVQDVPIGSSHPLLRSGDQASESSDTGTVNDYSPDDDGRKESTSEEDSALTSLRNVFKAMGAYGAERKDCDKKIFAFICVADYLLVDKIRCGGTTLKTRMQSIVEKESTSMEDLALTILRRSFKTIETYEAKRRNCDKKIFELLNAASSLLGLEMSTSLLSEDTAH